jgi:hypothetical protein
MTDEELQEVNGRLAGRPVADADLGQRFGTWVVGRLAARHDVKVRLRRAARGGVTALVFVPARLLAPPREEGQEAASPGQPAAEAGGTAMTRLPARRYLPQEPAPPVPPAQPPPGQPLPQRAPSASLAPDLAAAQAQRGLAGRQEPAEPGERQPGRSPDEVRSMLTRYRSGVERGRAEARDLTDPRDDRPT